MITAHLHEAMAKYGTKPGTPKAVSEGNDEADDRLSARFDWRKGWDNRPQPTSALKSTT
ncbi:hypothetical protein [Methylobacterium sp. AMS5]|uniref:hypothetical protein n=1 Tax=Methylobacterium sp. AMS5 TaxID=925818 RepID=UPI000A93166A|nr:hypothetical protein [Methylobacterium sp. AMS5]